MDNDSEKDIFNKEERRENIRVIYEDSSYSYFEFIKKRVATIAAQNPSERVCILEFNDENTKFLKKWAISDTIQRVDAFVYSKLFFNTYLMVELMKVNDSKESIQKRPIESFENFLHELQTRKLFDNTEMLDAAATLEEIFVEFKKNTKPKEIFVFLKNMNDERLQQRINSFLAYKPRKFRYNMRIFSDGKLCTYKNALEEPITKPKDYHTATPLSEEALVAFYKPKPKA